MNKLLESALVYASWGWHVFALTPGTKVPTKGSRGVYDATSDPSEIHRWWAEWPGANIGLATGDLAVVDLDVKGTADGIRAWRKLKTRLDLTGGTSTSKTPSGGYHLIYRANGIQIGNSCGRLGPGLDVRGQGGYIVLPPSRLPNGVYRWIVHPSQQAPVPLPRHLVELLATPERPASRAMEPISPVNGTSYSRAAVQGELATLARTHRGGRNNQLNTAAYNLGQLAGEGLLSRCEVESQLLVMALAIGLGEREALATIASGLTAGELNPRRRG